MDLPDEYGWVLTGPWAETALLHKSKTPRPKETQKNYKRCSRAERDTKYIQKIAWAARHSHFVFVL